MESSLSRIHSSNGQMESSDRCYCGQAHLPTTQSSNGRHDVGYTLLLGIQIVMPKSRCRRDLIGPACRSTNVAMGMKSSAHCYYEFEVSHPITEASI
jgi:hypothetical protein